MKRTIFLFLFIAVLVGLFAWLVVNRGELSLSGNKPQNVRTIIPSANNENSGDQRESEDSAAYDESRTQPLVLLEADETFLQAITVDINKDGVSDQICAVKKNSEPNIFLVPGLQNPLTSEYSRLQPIRTGVTQTRTLLFYSADIIGDRTNALVCSGMTAENLQLLAIYLPVQGNDGVPGYTAVADLRSDGSISIQEIARTDAYNLGLTNGESYPVYTYSSDPDAPQTLDQIERVYKWDKSLKRYEQVSESRIEGKKIESRLIRQLQSGNLDSFESFLGGLWYMPSASAGTTKYLFFDPEAKEIIFHNGTTEEVYTRESGSARRYGAYLTTRNKSISSIRRLIDIELTGIDEIRIKVLEDVKLKIGVASDWDGVYRKMSVNSTATQAYGELSPTDIQKILDSSTKDWVSADAQIFRISGNSFSLIQSNGTETGQYALLAVGGKPVIQFRMEGEDKKSRFYLINAETKTVSGGEQQRLTLTEVSVSIEGTNFMGSSPFIFSRNK